MGNDDLTIEILKQIRDELKQTRADTNERLDATNERLDATNERLGATNDRLDRVVQEQIRHATAIIQLERGQRDLTEQVRLGNRELAAEIRKVGDRIDNVLTGQLGQVVRATAARVDALEARVAKVEGR